MWIVDPDAELLTVSQLREGYWSEIRTFSGKQRVRAEPFDAAELNLAELWETK
jgi:hypothetical protein